MSNMRFYKNPTGGSYAVPCILSDMRMLIVTLRIAVRTRRKIALFDLECMRTFLFKTN